MKLRDERRAEAWPGISFLPVRNCVGAALCGFEARPSTRRSRSGDAASAGVPSKRRAHTLNEDELAWVLQSEFAAALLSRDMMLWLPVAGRAMSEGRVASVLAQNMPMLANAKALTLALCPPLTTVPPEALANALGHVAQLGCRVSLTLASVSPRALNSHVVAMCAPDEVRVRGSCTRSGAAQSLTRMVEALHQRDVAVTALDVATTQQCQVAIEANVDRLQGEIAGCARSAADLSYMLEDEV